jgi:hypothetical protein
VLWYLLIAPLDGALAFSVDQLYEPTILGGEQSRMFLCETNVEVCKGYNARTDSAGTGWITKSFYDCLGRVGRLARLLVRMKLHDYRRTVAVIMLAKGELRCIDADLRSDSRPDYLYSVSRAFWRDQEALSGVHVSISDNLKGHD